MYKDLKVDENLYFLQQWLFVLDYYKFDKDIIKLINELSDVVSKKIFTNFSFENKDIVNQETYIRFHLK